MIRLLICSICVLSLFACSSLELPELPALSRLADQLPTGGSDDSYLKENIPGLPDPAADKTSAFTTSVLKATATLDAAFLPKSTRTSITYTRADKRHLYDYMEMGRWLPSKASSSIYRLDRGLIWHLDHKKRTYYECAIGQCDAATNISEWLASDDDDDGTDGDDSEVDFGPDEAECPLTLKKYEIKVTKTGQKRVINGFQTNEYTANWLIQFEDAQKRVNEDTLAMEIWTTQPTRVMKQAWAIHDQFYKGMLKKNKAKENALSRFFEDEVITGLGAFSGDLGRDDNKVWESKTNRELAKVKGNPILIKTNWFRNANACTDESESDDHYGATNSSEDNPLGAFADLGAQLLGDQATAKMQPNPDAPIFSYDWEVTYMSVEQIRDSAFDRPPVYKPQADRP